MLGRNCASGLSRSEAETVTVRLLPSCAVSETLPSMMYRLVFSVEPHCSSNSRSRALRNSSWLAKAISLFSDRLARDGMRRKVCVSGIVAGIEFIVRIEFVIGSVVVRRPGLRRRRSKIFALDLRSYFSGWMDRLPDRCQAPSRRTVLRRTVSRFCGPAARLRTRAVWSRQGSMKRGFDRVFDDRRSSQTVEPRRSTTVVARVRPGTGTYS